MTEEKETKLAEEQTGTVFGLYQSKAKGFRTTFFAVATFSTLIFVIIFYPYVTFRGEKYQLQADIAVWDKERTAAVSQASGYPPIIDELRELRKKIRRRSAAVNWGELADQAEKQPRALSALKQSLQEDPDAGAWARDQGSPPELSSDLLERHPELARMREEPCGWHAGRDWQGCKLAEEIGAWHRKLTGNFRHRHPSEVRKKFFPGLADLLDRLHARFDRWLLGKAESWDPEVNSAQDKLRGNTRHFFQRYEREILNIESSLAKEEGELKSFASDRDEWIEGHKKTIEVIDDKLKDMKGLQGISTPFGELPVGLNELVLLFPLLLAAGFLASGSALADTLRLRHAYHKLCWRQDPEQSVFTREHIALVAPLWMDPLDPPRRRLLARVILAVPALLFVLAVLILLVNRLLWGDFMEEARLETWMYALLYLLGLVLIAEGLRRIRIAEQAYRLGVETNDEPSAPAETPSLED